ncbi:MATE family efflux transporter [uncultured Vibrio sp.]|uniref:MATE family efflux transporter n=1 Tax=uncultured Vibrio sp. TaxID=114054 RepID=UPI0025CD7131|nr:MATE family efflux transporter [uncultured Vibrio sp.]
MSVQAIDLRNDPISRTFWHYLLPAVSGMLVKAVFLTVDGIFIGQFIGANGLAALALTAPYFSIFTALSLMVGVGGATLMSSAMGRQDLDKAQSLFAQSMTLTMVICGAVAGLTLCFLSDIIALSGAQGEIATMTQDYLGTLLKFSLIYSLAWVLSCFIRNDTNPKLAMIAMCSGAAINVVFDYLFIVHFGWGIKGAALATGLSQVVILVILLSHFVAQKGRLRFDFLVKKITDTQHILSIGLPTFFIEVGRAMTMIAFNYVLLYRYGDHYVSAFGITMTFGLLAIFTMVGVGQACQPIFSFNVGANRSKRIWETFYLGCKVAFSIGIIMASITFFSAPLIATAFIGDEFELVQLTSTALRFYFLAAPLMGLNILIATLFQSTGSANKATLLSVGRGFVFVVAGLFFLPMVVPQQGVWASVVFAEASTLLMGGVWLKKTIQKEQYMVVGSQP